MCRHKNSTRRQNMTTQFITKRTSQNLLVILAAVCCGATLAPVLAQGPVQTKAKLQYQVSNLATLGGTSSGGNSINNQTWVAGYSRLAGNQSRHATLWRGGSVLDPGTLRGGPSTVTGSVQKTDRGILG